MDMSGAIGSLGELKKQEWTKTVCAHVPAGPSAWAWMARDIEGRFVAVVPDRRARSVFSAAYSVFTPGRRLFSLSDIPLAEDSLDDDALLVQRGETLLQWARTDNGVLVSTPMGLMAPFSFSDDSFSLGCGVDAGRERFLLWLSENGYERSDIVWKAGHYVSRGGIIDVYDPSSRMPVRVEFFDETVESLRFFSPRDQRSMGELEAIDIRSLKGAPQKGLEMFLDKNVSVVYCEPVETSAGADSFAWLWESLSEKPGVPGLLTWDEVRTLLSAGRKVEIERQVRPWSLRSGVMELPSFRGSLAALNASVKGWVSEGLDVELFGASPLLDAWSKEQGVHRWDGFPGGGFLDRNAARVLLSEEDVLGTGSFRKDSICEASPLPDWDISIGDYDYVVHDDYGIARNLGIERVTSGGVDRDCLVLEFGDERRLYLP
ncbi:MAG: CarD family transcriptional regulator, partial [Synergistota bacterium]|nr:CarD family transcriptional regulator [Synergistota bacterium]